MENVTLFASKKANLQQFLLSNSLLEVVVGDPWNRINYRPYLFYPPLPCQSKVSPNKSVLVQHIYLHDVFFISLFWSS